MKVLLNSFHLNGHTPGFHPQTQKLEPHLLTLGVKGLSRVNLNIPHYMHGSHRNLLEPFKAR